MDVAKKVINRFGEIPYAITYKDLCQILGIEHGKIILVGKEILDAAEVLAKASPRKRSLILLHDDLDEPAHRMINTMIKGTYAPPHKHTDPDTSEDLIVFRGAACVFEFTEDGKIVGRFPFGEGYKTSLVEIKPGSVHTVIPLTETVSFFEVKGQTKYDPLKDKTFFSWAPKEGDDKSVERWLTKLKY